MTLIGEARQKKSLPQMNADIRGLKKHAQQTAGLAFATE
jgi:hypothetical protein